MFYAAMLILFGLSQRVLTSARSSRAEPWCPENHYFMRPCSLYFGSPQRVLTPARGGRAERLEVREPRAPREPRARRA